MRRVEPVGLVKSEYSRVGETSGHQRNPAGRRNPKRKRFTRRRGFDMNWRMFSSAQESSVGQRVSEGRAASPVASPAGREVAFSFTGNASEYFRIWIVNMALTVVSLGVYSAWAKVRNRQYFLRHTWLDGASFDYTAQPTNILKGRAIVAAAFVLVYVANLVTPVLGGLLAFGMVLLVPWAVTSSLAFNARNTTYRNIRFGFTGTAGEAAGLYLLTMLLQVVT